MANCEKYLKYFLSKNKQTKDLIKAVRIFLASSLVDDQSASHLANKEALYQAITKAEQQEIMAIKTLKEIRCDLDGIDGNDLTKAERKIDNIAFEALLKLEKE